MRKVLLLVLLGFCLKSFAQDPFDIQMKAYKAALKNYDLQAASVSLYNMIALKPDRKDLQDSLVYLYFAGERYAQSYLIGEEIITVNPNRNDIREIVAVSKERLGMLKESITDYEILWNSEKKIYYLYQIAIIQYQLKRFGECVVSLDQLINNPDVKNESVSIQNKNSRGQDVPMLAAAFNVKGICAMDMNQNEIAITYFQKALEVYPQFELAANNLQALQRFLNEQKQLNSPSVIPAKPQDKPSSPKGK